MVSRPARTFIARDLLRVSYDPSGREKSPNDQHAAHKISAKREGFDLRGPSYRDIGSASRFATKARVNFERLIADLEADRFGADVLMLWENSRGSRKEDEWIKLIDLAAKRNVMFWIDVRNRLMDPRDPHDRRDLVTAAADAALETGLLSVRVLRGVKASAEAGLPAGPVPYGYKRVYSQKTGAFLRQVKEPKEAAVVAELFKRMAAREKLFAIQRDFAERGIEKRSGGPFSHAHLRTMLLNASYMGIRVHDPTRKSGHKVSPTAKRYKAVWPRIVSPQTFRKVQEIISDKSRFTGPDPSTRSRGGARHLLSLIVRCGVCGETLAATPVRTNPNEWRYSCRSVRGCSRIEKDLLDKWVTDLMMAWLSDPGMYSKLSQASEDASGRLDELEAKVAEIKEKRDILAAGVAAEEIDLEFATPIQAAYKQRIATLLAEAETLKPSVLEGVLEPGPDVAKRWEALDLDQKRFVARRLLVREYVGEVRIKPIGRGRFREKPPFEDRVFVLQNEGS